MECNIEKAIKELDKLLQNQVVKNNKKSEAQLREIKSQAVMLMALRKNENYVAPVKPNKGNKDKEILDLLNTVDISRVVGKSTKSNVWTMRNGNPNFGNPFYTVKPKNLVDGDIQVKSNDEATIAYYKWLTYNELPKGANKEALDKRRDVILDNLEIIKNAKELYYSGTAKGNRINHVTALIAVSEGKKPTITVNAGTQTKLIIRGNSKFNNKDATKFINANKLIAYGIEGTSTYNYAEDNKGVLNTGTYTSSDIVAVSLNGSSRANYKSNYALALEEVDKAIKAKATIVTDKEGTAAGERNSTHNKATEGDLAKYLENNGYVETNGNGVWVMESEKSKTSTINISSYSDVNTLAYKLTNPTNKVGHQYIIEPSTELTNEPKDVANVEGWYRANNARAMGIPEGIEGDIYDYNLMVRLISDKFKQYPELKKEVDKVGGKAFLENATHQIHTTNADKASRWETTGKNAKNMFIKALTEAYTNPVVVEKIGKENVTIKENFIEDTEEIKNKLNEFFTDTNFHKGSNKNNHTAIVMGTEETKNVPYEYYNNKHPAGQVMPDFIKTMLEDIGELEQVGKDYYNHVLINKFESTDIGTHQDGGLWGKKGLSMNDAKKKEYIYSEVDKEGNLLTEKAKAGSVAVVSIGSTNGKHKFGNNYNDVQAGNKGDTVSISAPSGSLVTMSTGELWHYVPKANGVRYSITPRHIPQSQIDYHNNQQEETHKPEQDKANKVTKEHFKRLAKNSNDIGEFNELVEVKALKALLKAANSLHNATIKNILNFLQDKGQSKKVKEDTEAKLNFYFNDGNGNVQLQDKIKELEGGTQTGHKSVEEPNSEGNSEGELELDDGSFITQEEYDKQATIMQSIVEELENLKDDIREEAEEVLVGTSMLFDPGFTAKGGVPNNSIDEEMFGRSSLKIVRFDENGYAVAGSGVKAETNALEDKEMEIRSNKSEELEKKYGYKMYFLKEDEFDFQHSSYLPPVASNPTLFKQLKEQMIELFPEVKLQYVERLTDQYGEKVIGKAIGNLVMYSRDSAMDTIVHEYAHIYIKMFKDTKIMKRGIEIYGDEEGLAQAIGEAVVDREGKAGNIWKRFVKWVALVVNKYKDALNITREDTIRELLVSAFLNNMNLSEVEKEMAIKDSQQIPKMNSIMIKSKYPSEVVSYLRKLSSDSRKEVKEVLTKMFKQKKDRTYEQFFEWLKKAYPIDVKPKGKLEDDTSDVNVLKLREVLNGVDINYLNTLGKECDGSACIRVSKLITEFLSGKGFSAKVTGTSAEQRTTTMEEEKGYHEVTEVTINNNTYIVDIPQKDYMIYDLFEGSILIDRRRNLETDDIKITKKPSTKNNKLGSDSTTGFDKKDFEDLSKTVYSNPQENLRLLDMLDQVEANNGARAKVDSTKHKNHLRTILSIFTDKAATNIGKFNLLLSKEGDKTVGEVDLNENTIAIKVSRRDSISTSDKSVGEVFVHEVIHPAIEYALSAGLSTSVRNRLERLYTQARKELTVEDFYPDTFLFNEEIEKAEAKKVYGYVFNSKHGLREFIVHGLTNERLIKALGNVRTYEKRDKPTTIKAQLEYYFKQIMDFITQKFRREDKDLTGDKLLLKLSKDLALAQYKALDTGKKGTIENAMYKAGDGIERLNDRMSSMIKEMEDKVSDFNSNIKIQLPERTDSALKSTWIVMKQFGKLLLTKKGRNLIGFTFGSVIPGLRPEGTIQMMLRAMSEPDALERTVEMLALAQNAKDNSKKTYEQAMKRIINEGFKDKLTDSQKVALNSVLIQTDIPTMSKGLDVKKMLDDDEYLDSKIKEYHEELKNTYRKSDYNYLRHQAHGLGYYIATGNNKLASQKFSSFAIIDSIKRADTKAEAKEHQMIDDLASMYALKYTAKDAKKIVSEIWDTENTKNKEEIHGVDNLLDIAHYPILRKIDLIKESGGDIVHEFRKADYFEQFDENVTYKIDKITNRDKLHNEGYKLVERVDVKGNKDLAVYINRDWALEAWNTQGMSIIGDTSKGISAYSVRAHNATESDKKDLNERFGDQINNYYSNEHTLSVLDNELNMESMPNEISAVTRTDYKDDIKFSFNLEVPRMVKQSQMGKESRVDNVLGHSASRYLDVVNSKENNKKLVDIAYEDFSNIRSNPDYNETQYVEVTSTSKIKLVREAYEVMPQYMKDYIEKKFKGRPMIVRRDLLLMYFGNRAPSIADTKVFENHPTTKRLVKLAGHIVEGVVKLSTSSILIKTPIVMIRNLLGNFATITGLKGIRPDKAIKYLWEGWTEAKNFINLTEELAELKVKNKIGDVRVQGRINQIETWLEESPVGSLMGQGFYQAIVEGEDVNDASGLVEHTLDKYMNKLPNWTRVGLDWVFITSRTPLYKALYKFNSLADFISRYAVWKDFQEKKRTPRMKEKIKKLGLTLVEYEKIFKGTLLDLFTNFDKGQGIALQWLEKLGPVKFSKFLINTQRSIKQTVRENPLYVLNMLISQYLTGMDTDSILSQQLLLTDTDLSDKLTGPVSYIENATTASSYEIAFK